MGLETPHERAKAKTYWGNTLQRQDALRKNTLPTVQTKSQLTADLSRTRGVSPSSGKHSVTWSLSYVLTARAEPNAIFPPLKNEWWGRDRKPSVHVGLKNCLFPYRKESDYGELCRSREYMIHDSWFVIVVQQRGRAGEKAERTKAILPKSTVYIAVWGYGSPKTHFSPFCCAIIWRNWQENLQSFF